MDEVKNNLSICEYVHKVKCANASWDSSKIDFTQHSFIIFDLIEGTCDISKIKTELLELPKHKKNIFLIKIHRLDDSKVGVYVPIRELTPKLKMDYNFEYKIELY